MKLVLSSSSPARKTLLERFKVAFTTCSPDIDETPLQDEKIEQTVSRLARQKAEINANAFQDAIIIGSDQLIQLGPNILGKPGNHDNAVAQLQACSNKVLTSHTGLCVINTKTGLVQTDVIPYQVKFKPLTTTLIEQYLQADQPYFCAGSIKAESMGSCLFEWLRGDDPTALTGLPLIRLNEMLIHAGFTILANQM